MSLGRHLAGCARYLAAIAVVSAIVWAPIGHVAFHVQMPATVAQARVVLRVGWLVAGSGMLALLVLVGAVAPVVRAAARAHRRDAHAAGGVHAQLAMLRACLGGLVRALAPAAIALIAVALGCLALALPGILLYALLVLAPASTAGGVRAQLADSVARVRARPLAIGAVLAGVLVVLGGVVLVLQLRLPVPLGKKPTAAELAAFPQLVHAAAIAAAAVLPPAAVALAAIGVRAAPDR